MQEHEKMIQKLQQDIINSLYETHKNEGRKVILRNYPVGIEARDVLRFGLEIGQIYTVDTYFEEDCYDKPDAFSVFLVEDRDVPECDSRCGLFFSEEDVEFIDEG